MTWITAQRPFRMPEGLTSEQEVTLCIGIINKYRCELPHIRAKSTRLQDKTKTLEEEVEYWKKKYQEEKKKRETVEEELEKVLKKKKGGQTNHADTNREAHEDYSCWPRGRVFVKECGDCGRKLTRVNAARTKVQMDVIINPEVVKLILESERQWCGNCKREVYVQDTRSLPFTEYGINTFMTVMILRFRAHASFANIATIIQVSHGLYLSKSDVSNLVKTAGNYLRKRYEELKKAVREGRIMYQDETGWLIHGQKAWMWIMANENTTVYVAAESGGKGIAEEL